MFQDIEPYQFSNAFKSQKPADGDYVLIYEKERVLFEERDGNPALPRWRTIHTLYPDAELGLIYLFSVDETAFFLSLGHTDETEHFKYENIFIFREMKPEWLAFAGATAFHLALWYDTHRFCGRCAAPTEHKTDERAVFCPSCGHIDYPKIAPVVIVGITDGDKLLLTKYAAGYKRYALVAGFVEIGETLESAVRREVLEEVGLRVKNIRYYKSQPWAFSGSILSGFFADLDGSAAVTVDETELSEAGWFSRDSIPPGDSTLSLTWTMVEAFRSGKV